MLYTPVGYVDQMEGDKLFTWPPKWALRSEEAQQHKSEPTQTGPHQAKQSEDPPSVPKGEEMAKIDVEFVEPAPAGSQELVVQVVDEVESEYGPRLKCSGLISGTDQTAILWLPRPEKITSAKSNIVKVYNHLGIDWKELEYIDPVSDLIDQKIPVELSYTEEGYARLKVKDVDA